MKLTFENPESAIDKERLLDVCQAQAGVSARIVDIAKRSGDGKDIDDNTFVIITCLKKYSEKLVAYGPHIKKFYPSFKTAVEVSSHESFEPPQDKQLIQLTFKDTHLNWLEGRAIQLMIDIAEMTGLSRETMRLVQVLCGSVIIVLRLPKSAVQTLRDKESEFKVKYPTFEKMDLIADSAVQSQPVSATHAPATSLFFRQL